MLARPTIRCRGRASWLHKQPSLKQTVTRRDGARPGVLPMTQKPQPPQPPPPESPPGPVSWMSLLRTVRAPLSVIVLAGVAVVLPPQSRDMLAALGDGNVVLSEAFVFY